MITYLPAGLVLSYKIGLGAAVYVCT
jgi:hypothetical protein